MRRAALMAVPFALSGCSGFGKHLHDTVFWPGYNPNQPQGSSENLLRVRGEKPLTTPLLSEGGNIWPGPPQPLPTLRDVENPNSSFNHALGDPATYFGGTTLEERSSGMVGEGTPSGEPIRSGDALSIGERTATHTGVSTEQSRILPSLPSSVPDVASRYLRKNTSQSIAISNGDGTSTVVAPDGTTRIVRDREGNR